MRLRRFRESGVQVMPGGMQQRAGISDKIVDPVERAAALVGDLHESEVVEARQLSNVSGLVDQCASNSPRASAARPKAPLSSPIIRSRTPSGWP